MQAEEYMELIIEHHCKKVPVTSNASGGSHFLGELDAFRRP